MKNHKRIDINRLIELIKQGKTQKEAAEILGVSPSAVCQRLKRIMIIPESMEKLTPKEQKFCLEKAKGKSNIQAVMDSYDVTSRNSAKVIANRLVRKPEVQQAIADLMAQEGIDRRYRVRKLAEHINNSDPMVSLKALDQSWKLDGSYHEASKVDVTINIPSLINLEKYRINREKEIEADYEVED